MCSLRCLPRPPFHRKALSQIEHYKGFSPICLLECLPRPPFNRGALSQKLYYKGFLPVCIIIFKRKNLSHNQDALLWHLISMYFQVSLRCSLNKKNRLIKIVALVWSLPLMFPHVISRSYHNYYIVIVFDMAFHQ